MRNAIIQALEDRYNAQISEADATIKIYLDHSVGIGEHPQHIEEIDNSYMNPNITFNNLYAEEIEDDEEDEE